MPVRRHEPIFVPSRSSAYATRHDYGIEDSISRADYLSNAILSDTYEAAKHSRGKDHALLRNLNAAIRSPSRSRDSTPIRTGRPAKRYQSLPQVEIKPTSSSRAVVPYKNVDKMRSNLTSAPSPSSLLSSRINSYLRGSSATPQTIDSFSYKNLLPTRSISSDAIPHISYKHFLSDPSPSSTLTSKYIHGYVPSTLTSSYRSPSPFLPKAKTNNYDYDYLGSDDDDYEPETNYRRKYKIVRSPVGSTLGSGVRRIGDSIKTYHRSTSPEGSDVDEYYNDDAESYGTYSSPRPSGVSRVKLSSYDGAYDGSYEADMAEMYDYVPFGPSRHGILELTEHEDTNRSSPYLTSSLRSVSPPPVSYTSLSAVPTHYRYMNEPLTKPYQSSTSLDAIVSSAAARAKQALENSKLPDYKHASLVLSVEGSAVSEDGKNRYGFRYYPPPIPLKGSHIGLDERILGISPTSTTAADSFLSKYLNKLHDIRSEVRDHVERGEYARGRSVMPVSRPSYVHSTVHMPVHFGDRAHSVPVSSYRSRLDNGQSHRVDVFPLVVSETTLPSDRKLHLPYYKAGGESSGSPTKLTVLEKINIKVSTEQHVNPRVSAVSRRVRASTAPPASRPLPGQQVQQQQYIQAEAPWYLRARGGSVPPTDNRNVRATSVPPRPRKAQQVYKAPEPLPSEKLHAHRPVAPRPDILRTIRARSLEPTRRSDYQETSYQSSIPSTQLWAHRPHALRKDAGLLAKAKAQERQSYPRSLWQSASLPRNFDKASDYYFSIPDVRDRATLRYSYTSRGRFGPDSKPPRPSLGNLSQVYVPLRSTGPSNATKAAIIGSRWEAEGGRTHRRPRSEYAANKLRDLKREETEEGIYYRTPSTSALYASRPPLPKPTERKAIRDVDGFTKPRNLLSWQYRVESKLSPDDIIYEPSRFIRMREQVKDIQEKMNKQRQLLDRYLNSDFKIAPKQSQNAGGNPAEGESSNRPVSELRRKLRRTIAQGKNNPDYFREENISKA